MTSITKKTSSSSKNATFRGTSLRTVPFSPLSLRRWRNEKPNPFREATRSYYYF